MWAVLQAIKRSWLKHFITQLTSLFILTATYSVALFIILSTNNIKNIFSIWGKVNETTIYLKNDYQPDQLESLNSYLSSHDFVQSYSFESSADSAKAFKEKFQQISSQKMDEKNISQFFPAIVKINLNKSFAYKTDKTSLESFATTIEQKFSFVSEVSYGKVWLSKYEKLISSLESMSWIIVTVILLASFFVSSNVIKTVLYAKKEEIEILEFIGASPFWILSPHILNIAILSAFSFFVAATINLALFSITMGSMSQLFSISIIQELHFISIPALMGYSVFIVSGVCLYSVFSMHSLLPYKRQKTVLVEVNHS